tara:strand:- start:2016 stop:2765 length:750 start_codon:yes stop_codon:yes gene_type:complete
MASQLQDAKISIRLDTESAEQTLSELEERVKKDAEDIKEQTDKVDGETALQRQEKRRKEAMLGPASADLNGPTIPRIEFKAPDIERLTISVAQNLTAATISAVPVFGPPASNIAKAGIAAAIPALEFGAPAAFAAAEEIMGLEDSGLPSGVTENVRDYVRNQINILSSQISELRARQSGLNAMFESTGDIVKTQLGVGVSLDPEFLKKNAEDQFKIGEAKALLGANMKKAVKNLMGEALGKTVRLGPGS